MNLVANILLVGFGSIGRRHYANLLALGHTAISVVDPDDSRFIDQPGVRRFNQELSEQNLAQFNIVFICNPTSAHIPVALLAARAGCHLFIEKPLSHTLEGARELALLAIKQKLITMVGCNLRFDPAISKMKELCAAGAAGKILAVYLEYGRYLPYQRPTVDYRTVYAGKKAMGGGVLLDDIHDFDLLTWFSDQASLEKIQIFKAHVSNLEIDVEDIANVVVQFENGIIGSIRCDYLQQYKHRNLKIIGEKANLVWEFRENKIWGEYYDQGTERRDLLAAFEQADPNKMYQDELNYFLSCVQDKKETFHGVSDAAAEIESLLTAKL